MPSLTRDTLAENAFRTLGLPATAGQAAVDAAARRLRLWPDPARIPPTPWDVPWLGPIRRARPDVEQAVAKLTDPAQRVAERVLWYHGTTPPADPTAATATAGIDAAVAALQAAVVADPTAEDVDRWRDALARWSAHDADYASALAAAERDGDFEKQATAAEVRSAAAAVPVAVADALAGHAQTALDDGDVARCHALVAAVRTGGHGRSVDDLLDRMEDVVVGRCKGIDADLRAVLRIVHTNPRPWWAKNLGPTHRAADAYNATVNPTLTAFATLLADADEPWRLVRVRSACGDVLILVGLGWEWSGEYATAEATLVLAADLARGSPAVASRVDQALDRVRTLTAYHAWAAGPLLNDATRTDGPGTLPRPTRRRRAVDWARSSGVGWGVIAVVLWLTGSVFRYALDTRPAADEPAAVTTPTWMVAPRPYVPPQPRAPSRVGPSGRAGVEVNRGR